MHITMVKKRLTNGQPCRKCLKTQELLVSRGLWHRIDAVVWALEDDPTSAGWRLAERHGVARAPFFIARADDGTEKVYVSALALIREQLSEPRATSGADARPDTRSDTRSVKDAHPTLDADAEAVRLADAAPADIVRFALEIFGARCAIAFSGAEDVALIDMARKSGFSFSVICLDTGRLHPETYQFIERVRTHYDIAIEVYAPDTERVESLVRDKGLFSFLRDGHAECCEIRKVAPLTRALSGYRAWMTGQRRDQSLATRAGLPVVQPDPRFAGVGGALCKFNPLAAWTSARVWDYIRTHDVPHNPLHERGFASIGCAPCTRPVLPGQHEREGRWWWERASDKECGLHVDHTPEQTSGTR